MASSVAPQGEVEGEKADLIHVSFMGKTVKSDLNVRGLISN